MQAMSKKQKKHLKELSGRCYELEMSEALNELFDSFQKWKSGEINAFDLNEIIHQHHNYKARDLYKIYEMLKNPQNAVARGVSLGIIKMDDIQKDCHPFVEELVEYYDQNKKDRTTN
jgi:predicted ATP-dependent endonuclease of OLD family